MATSTKENKGDIMLDYKKQSEMDQAGTFLGENLPPLWRHLYLGCISEGFIEMESFKLVQTFILSQAPNGVRGSDG